MDGEPLALDSPRLIAVASAAVTARIEPWRRRRSAAARAALYAGRIFKLAPTEPRCAWPTSRPGCCGANSAARTCGGSRRATPPERLFAAVGRVRRALYTSARWHEAVRDLIAASGFDPAAYAFDPLRLRTVLHRGHEIPARRAVYVAHRDTWYAHPQAAITWWLPLDDLDADETFVFYPDAFATPGAERLGAFDYDRWVQDGWALKIGWQDGRRDGRRVIRACSAPTRARRSASPAVAARLLLFSGAHLHRTLPQATGRARFSLDFRIAHLGDVAAGTGAPNADNRSRGSALPGDSSLGGGERSGRAPRTRARLSANPPGTTS